jgi:hypothetical protein
MTRRSLPWLLVCLAACGPRVRPDWAEDREPPPTKVAKVAPVAPGRGVLIGEMCPDGAGGRPAVAPLIVRDVSWSSDADDVQTHLERNAKAFAVLGLDGRRAGVFEVLGAADVGLPGEVAIGSYAGRSPCTPFSEEGGAPEDAVCVKTTKGCALAVASIDRVAAETAEVPDLETGGACVSGESLVVDIDGDGATESFPLAQFVDPVRAPSEEVLAAPVVSPSCNPRFSLYGQVVKPPPDPDVADDARYHVTLDVVGIADLDGDGRREVVVSFRYPEGRTFAVYSALDQSGRLELVGEAVPWQ